jgi:hypothetical protein
MTMHTADRNEAIARIKAALKARSNKRWSVRGGRGTSWGWIDVTSPPSRQNEFGYLTEEDRADLARLFGLDVVHRQGLSIAASSDYYREYIDRAEGRTPAVIAQPYWD